MSEEKKYKLGTKFRVERYLGEFTSKSKEVIKDQLSNLKPSSWSEFSIKEVGGGYQRPTRYKYYFSAFLPSIFSEVRKRYEINGEHPNTPEELHTCLKAEFNCVYIINTETGEQRTTTQSTTNLSDREFISLYQESILEMAMNAPYFCEPEFYDSWKEKMRIKHEGTKA